MPVTLTSRTVVKILLWVFCLSFALDFKGVLKSGAETGGSGAQMIYLAIALGSSTLIAWMGRRTLLTKPGVYMLMLWWGYLAFTAVVAVLNGVDLAKYMRNIVPPLLCGLGLLVAHVSACSGLRAREIVAPLAVCAGINIVWRLFFGYAVLEVTIDTARVEILSASLDWVFALVACSLLLAKRWNPRVLFLGALAIACLFLSVTRALMIPIAISGIVAGFCMLLGIRWKMFRISIIGQKAVPLAVAAAGCIMLLGLAFLIRPEMFDRWNDRLFHFGDRTSKDLSLLTREAEAVGVHCPIGCAEVKCYADIMHRRHCTD